MFFPERWCYDFTIGVKRLFQPLCAGARFGKDRTTGAIARTDRLLSEKHRSQQEARTESMTNTLFRKGSSVASLARGAASLLLALVLLAGIPSSALAGEAQDKADLAVANILFDYDGANEFASYRVNDSGFVDITFASNMPDALYSEILDRLQHNPDIGGVLAGRGGSACSFF
jgi:hypothetical protein